MNTSDRIAVVWLVAMMITATGDALSGINPVWAHAHRVQVQIWVTTLFAAALLSMTIAFLGPQPARPRATVGALAIYIAGLFLGPYQAVWQSWEIAFGTLQFPVPLYPFVWAEPNGWEFQLLMIGGAMVTLVGARLMNRAANSQAVHNGGPSFRSIASASLVFWR